MTYILHNNNNNNRQHKKTIHNSNFKQAKSIQKRKLQNCNLGEEYSDPQ